jgi:hypothetical protein
MAWALAFASVHSGLPINPGAEPQVALRPISVAHAGEMDPATGHVSLPPTWRNDAEGACTLAHEMTHLLQVENRVPSSDRRAVEAQALTVSAACFDAYGLHDRGDYDRRMMGVWK